MKDDEIVYFKLQMTREKRNMIKSRAYAKGMTMQGFIQNCIEKCCETE